MKVFFYRLIYIYKGVLKMKSEKVIINFKRDKNEKCKQ